MSINREHFFDAARRLFGGHYNQRQVDGMTAILDQWEQRFPAADPRWLAYMLATAFHETNQTMQPVREAYWLSEEWRRRNLRYYPFYGRGYVQLTWEANYRRAGDYVGVNLVRNPDLALRPDYAAAVMFVGMTEGWFRRDPHGRQTLSRYFSASRNDPAGAREIINGTEWKTDRSGRRVRVADIIAGYYRVFLDAVTLVGSPVAPREAVVASRDLDQLISGAAFTSLEGDAVPVSSEGYAESSGEPAADFAGEQSADVGGDADFAPITILPEAPAQARDGQDQREIIRHAVDIVTAYVGRNTLAPADVPGLIRDVYEAMQSLGDAAEVDEPETPQETQDAGGTRAPRRSGRRSSSKR